MPGGSVLLRGTGSVGACWTECPQNVAVFGTRDKDHLLWHTHVGGRVWVCRGVGVGMSVDSQLSSSVMNFYATSTSLQQENPHEVREHDPHTYSDWKPCYKNWRCEEVKIYRIYLFVYVVKRLFCCLWRATTCWQLLKVSKIIQYKSRVKCILKATLLHKTSSEK